MTVYNFVTLNGVSGEPMSGGTINLNIRPLKGEQVLIRGSWRYVINVRHEPKGATLLVSENVACKDTLKKLKK